MTATLSGTCSRKSTARIDPDRVVSDVQGRGEGCDDVDVRPGVLVDPEVAGRPVVGGAHVQRQQPPATGPRQCVGLEVPVVERDGLPLDERVGLRVALGVGVVHPLQVEALADEVELPVSVEPAHEVLVVEHGPVGGVAPYRVVRRAGERADVVGGVPDVGHVVRRRCHRDRVDVLVLADDDVTVFPTLSRVELRRGPGCRRPASGQRGSRRARRPGVVWNSATTAPSACGVSRSSWSSSTSSSPRARSQARRLAAPTPVTSYAVSTRTRSSRSSGCQRAPSLSTTTHSQCG